MRYLFVLERGKLPLDRAAGGTFEYSNTNFVIVGAMIERIEGKTWDELITEKIFNPLELKSAGLGMQGSLGKIDAPLAHTSENGKIKAILPGPNSDNLAIIGPAGIAHMSVLDFARWAGWNAGEGKHKPYLVKPETMKKLHTPVISMPEKKDAAPGTPSSGKYAFGWGELSVAWAPHPLVYHGGSNGKNLAHIWLDVKEDAAIVVMSNISGQKTNEAFFSLAKELYTKYIKKL
jgi:CubicO group peptidase (beta-lactamase class C family)